MINHFRFYLALLVLLVLSTKLNAQVEGHNIDSIKAYVQKLSSDTEKINTLLDIAWGLDCDDSAGKIEIAFEARRISEKVNWLKGVLKANRFIGDIYLKCQKNNIKAFEYYQQNIEFSKKNNDKLNWAISLDNIAKQYGEVHDHSKSIEYYKQELELKPGLSMEAAVYGKMGISYMAIGLYPMAIVFYDSSLNLLNSKKNKDAQDSMELAGLYLNKGEIYLIMDQPDKAFANYQYVLKIGKHNNDKQIMIWGLTGVGKTYKMKKDYKQAIDNYQNALRVCNEINVFDDEVKIEVELAITYMETWDLKKALDYADSSLSLAETQHYINLLSKCNATLGNIYLKKNMYSLAISYLQKALSIAEQTVNLEDQKDALLSLSTAYSKAGQWQQSNVAIKSYYVVRDSLYNIEKANEFTKAQLTTEFKNNQEIERLKQDAVYGKKIERQRILTYSGFAALVLVILLAFFIYRNFKTQKKYNDLLSREKKRHLAHIEAQTNILSDIAHTQAHEIRGPISTILGLVNIFNYDDPADPINKQVMEWISSTTEKLDTAVKNVITRENELRGKHENDESSNE